MRLSAWRRKMVSLNIKGTTSHSFTRKNSQGCGKSTKHWIIKSQIHRLPRPQRLDNWRSRQVTISSVRRSRRWMIWEAVSGSSNNGSLLWGQRKSRPCKTRSLSWAQSTNRLPESMKLRIWLEQKQHRRSKTHRCPKAPGWPLQSLLRRLKWGETSPTSLSIIMLRGVCYTRRSRSWESSQRSSWRAISAPPRAETLSTRSLPKSAHSCVKERKSLRQHWKMPLKSCKLRTIKMRKRLTGGITKKWESQINWRWQTMHSSKSSKERKRSTRKNSSKCKAHTRRSLNS